MTGHIAREDVVRVRDQLRALESEERGHDTAVCAAAAGAYGFAAEQLDELLGEDAAPVEDGS